VLHVIISRGRPELIHQIVDASPVRDRFVIILCVFDAMVSKASLVRSALTQLTFAAKGAVFVDDNATERGEVATEFPEITTCEWTDVEALLQGPRGPYTPRSPDGERRQPTPDERTRHHRVAAQLSRDAALHRHVRTGGDRVQFLRQSGLRMTIRPIDTGDFPRIANLTDRVSQLRATGTIYSETDLKALRHAPDYHLVVADLVDNYVDYDLIGIALLHTPRPGHAHHHTDDEQADRAGQETLANWADRTATLEFLLMSCTVISAGAGTVFLAALRAKLAASGMARMIGAFVPTDRNEPMWNAYGNTGFVLPDGSHPSFEDLHTGEHLELVTDLASPRPLPDYVAFTDLWTPDGLPSLAEVITPRTEPRPALHTSQPAAASTGVDASEHRGTSLVPGAGAGEPR
jgi:methoxymalonate biosynthesis protein